MSDSKNLWSTKIGHEQIKVPKTFLIEQANHLGDLTKNRLIAKIYTTQAQDSEKENWIVHEFDIISPALGNYRFTLFRVIHKISMYPLNIYFNLKDEKYQNVSKDDFESVLAKVLADKMTIDTINGLLAQS